MIALLVTAIFIAISLAHVYWALSGRLGGGAYIPQLPAAPGDGPHTPRVAAFKPSVAATLLVAAALAVIAGLVVLWSGLLGEPVRHWSIQWAIGAVATAMLLRAVGDFRLVGFFKRVKDSAFARMDTLYYSPLCVALGLGLGRVALS